MPTELELIALQTEFELYLPFSKRLVLNLPNCQDRTRAAMWLQKLRSIRNDEQKKLRNEHLKLLLFALHRRSLVGVFAHKPPKDELESFHDGLTLLEMTRELIEITEKKQSSGDNGNLAPGECPLPKVMSTFSHDLKEYSAMQTIPKFGAHVYYAVSSEPVQFWKKSETGEYPGMGDIPSQPAWERALMKLTDNVLKKQAEADARIALLKAIESGEASADELDADIDFNKKIQVKVCPPCVFKWKLDSRLNLYQNYNFANIGVAENIEEQGTHQLELDEDAFSILDQSLPGRQRVRIRDPFFEQLPEDLLERRHHGVVDVIPDWDSIPDEEEEDSVEECPCCPEGHPKKDQQDDDICSQCCSSPQSQIMGASWKSEGDSNNMSRAIHRKHPEEPKSYGRGYLMEAPGQNYGQNYGDMGMWNMGYNMPPQAQMAYGTAGGYVPSQQMANYQAQMPMQQQQAYFYQQQMQNQNMNAYMPQQPSYGPQMMNNIQQTGGCFGAQTQQQSNGCSQQSNIQYECSPTSNEHNSNISKQTASDSCAPNPTESGSFPVKQTGSSSGPCSPKASENACLEKKQSSSSPSTQKPESNPSTNMYSQRSAQMSNPQKPRPGSVSCSLQTSKETRSCRPQNVAPQRSGPQKSCGFVKVSTSKNNCSAANQPQQDNCGLCNSCTTESPQNQNAMSSTLPQKQPASISFNQQNDPNTKSQQNKSYPTENLFRNQNFGNTDGSGFC